MTVAEVENVAILVQATKVMSTGRKWCIPLDNCVCLFFVCGCSLYHVAAELAGFAKRPEVPVTCSASLHALHPRLSIFTPASDCLNVTRAPSHALFHSLRPHVYYNTRLARVPWPSASSFSSLTYYLDTRPRELRYRYLPFSTCSYLHSLHCNPARRLHLPRRL